MTSPIRILHLEDDPNDAELIAIELASKREKWPHALFQVSTQAQFSDALAQGFFDVILADNSGPAFSGHDALRLARQKNPQAVFLFVSGYVEGNPTTVTSSTGADGFVIKDHLHDLLPAILRALESKKRSH